MKPLKVSEVNSYIKRLFSSDMILSNIEVQGEISNYKRHYSGHLYFSLKDETGKIKCVMFRNNAKKLNGNLIEGQKVIAKGYISIYERNGEYQLYVSEVDSQGVGELYRKYEILKNKLEKEGLFNTKFKKEIPFMPNKIGIVTSATGAAIKDMLTVIDRRYPICDILIYPSLVQGINAPSNLIKAINYLDNRSDIDLIIFGRGGGSIDELFAFNDEDLARSIFNCETPVISAVGHETDFTTTDFVSDLRAATPSAAAELAVPNIIDLIDNLNNKYNELIYYNNINIKTSKAQLDILSRELKYNNPSFKIGEKKQDLDILFQEINKKLKDLINNQGKKLLGLENRLQLLDPSISLKDGNGILLNENGCLVKSIKELSLNDNLKVIMKDGSIDAVVQNVNKEEKFHEN
ncbi:MAG TPA: exodeoxyribonuclease VII large subunit [Tissierellaceae bacterium]|nr:exodeoxyribonuclease VII large subunit [Tissierellaceae bacterium]